MSETVCEGPVSSVGVVLVAHRISLNPYCVLGNELCVRSMYDNVCDKTVCGEASRCKWHGNGCVWVYWACGEAPTATVGTGEGFSEERAPQLSL